MRCCQLRYAILDSCFSPDNQRGRGIAAKYLAWELQRHGISENTLDNADCILVTCTSPTDAQYLWLLRKQYPSRVIVAGGPASTSPYTLGTAADLVCVGDGQKLLKILFENGIDATKQCPNAWIHGESRLVTVDQDFPWAMPPIQAEDGAYRIWCGRGCKNKCKFCQTGWAIKYAENPNPELVIAQAIKLVVSGCKINYLSNDPAQHTFYNRLPAVGHGSYSIKYLKLHGLPAARQVRLGVEGVSERLRKSVNKAISHKDLLDCTVWLSKNKKSVRWFLIAGLPGETAQDWAELREIIQEYKAATTKGVLALNFTAWLPHPATPMAICPVTDDYWTHVEAFWDWFFAGPGWSNRIKLMKPRAPQSRMKQAIAYMGLDEATLRNGGNWGPNSRVAYPNRSDSTII